MAHSNSAAAAVAAVGTPGAGGNQQFLTFLLGREMFAIEILNIKEIIEYGRVTAVPMVPTFVRGVINLRGRVVPVVDLQARFGRQSDRVGKRTCIVIVEVENAGEHRDIGGVVDAVSEVLEIQPADIEEAPAFGARLHPAFIAGMGKIDDEFVIILDVEKVLSLTEMTAMVSQSNAMAD